eukprot:scaffold13239_cov69-Phaeocystis_antarctica.AAC.3
MHAVEHDVFQAHRIGDVGLHLVKERVPHRQRGHAIVLREQSDAVFGGHGILKGEVQVTRGRGQTLVNVASEAVPEEVRHVQQDYGRLGAVAEQPPKQPLVRARVVEIGGIFDEDEVRSHGHVQGDAALHVPRRRRRESAVELAVRAMREARVEPVEKEAVPEPRSLVASQCRVRCACADRAADDRHGHRLPCGEQPHEPSHPHAIAAMCH